MTTQEIIIIACIIAPFAIFAFALALVDYRTADVRRANSVQLPGPAGKSAAPDFKQAA